MVKQDWEDIKTNKIKICYFADADSTHTKRWVASINRSIFEIIVITYNYSKIRDIPIYTIKPPKLFSPYSPNRPFYCKFYYLFISKKVKSIVREFDPDIIHSFWATSYGYIGSRLANKIFFVSVWGKDVSTINNFSFLKRFIVKSVFKRSNYIFCTSKYLKNKVSEFTNKQAIQIPFGVDTKQFFKKEIYNKKEIVIGSTKNFEAKYGLKYLIEAFYKLSKKYHNIKLLLIGKGTEKNYYKRLIRKYKIEHKVEIVNHVHHNKLPLLLKDIDIFVMPSIFEEFGVAALEAASMGIPTIASNCGGIKEVVRNNKSGFLIEPKNISQIVKYTSKLIESHELREMMGDYARNFVLNNYQWDDNVSLKESIYIKYYSQYIESNN